MKRKHSSRKWFRDPFMRHWLTGVFFPLPKAQPGAADWHWPFVIMGAN